MTKDRIITQTISTADLLLAQGLGEYPYVLLRLLPDPEAPNEPLLTVTAGNGPEDHPMFLPITYVMMSPAQGNLVAEMLRDQWRDQSEAGRAAVEAITREFNADWIPFVTGVAK